MSQKHHKTKAAVEQNLNIILAVLRRNVYIKSGGVHLHGLAPRHTASKKRRIRASRWPQCVDLIDREIKRKNFHVDIDDLKHYANCPVPNLATTPTGPCQTWPLRQLARAKPGHYANWPRPNLATMPTSSCQTWPLRQLARAKPGHSAN